MFVTAKSVAATVMAVALSLCGPSPTASADTTAEPEVAQLAAVIQAQMQDPVVVQEAQRMIANGEFTVSS